MFMGHLYFLNGKRLKSFTHWCFKRCFSSDMNPFHLPPLTPVVPDEVTSSDFCLFVFPRGVKKGLFILQFQVTVHHCGGINSDAQAALYNYIHSQEQREYIAPAFPSLPVLSTQDWVAPEFSLLLCRVHLRIGVSHTLGRSIHVN